MRIQTVCIAGETEFQIGDVRRPITTWLTLSDSRHNNSPYGELMFSLSYLPTAERLTVVVVKARNLKLNEDDPNNALQSVFVKVRMRGMLCVNKTRFDCIVCKSNVTSFYFPNRFIYKKMIKKCRKREPA